MILLIVLMMLIAIEHLGIMVMEIWGRPEQQARAFDLPVEYTRQRPARISFANQGIYNGMLGILIIASYWLVHGITLITVWQMLLVFIMVVALFGGFTATRKIWLFQLLPAVLAFLLTLYINWGPNR